MFDSKNAVLIANPKAAAGKVRRNWEILAPQFQAQFGEIEMILTEFGGHATTLAKDAVLRGKTHILSLGGDGTHNEVINGIMAADPKPGAISLGILPSGTGGDLRRMLAYRNDVLEAAQVISKTKPLSADVGHLTFFTHDGQKSQQYFLNVCSFGMGGLVDRYVNASHKRFGGRISFFAASLRAFKNYRPARVELIADGVLKGEFEIMNVAVANGRYFGGGMKVAPEASLSSGHFEVVVMKPTKLFRTIRSALRVYKGRHTNCPHISSFQAKVLEARLIGSDPAYLDIDGEAPGVIPSLFKIKAGAIQLYGL